MIPPLIIKKSLAQIPWRRDDFIEQDLIISRALIDLYNNPVIAKNLIFRGGTALNKLHLKEPSRYSEDIDFVLAKKQGIGHLLDEIRTSLSWLGKPKTTRDKFGFKSIFKFTNVLGFPSKLKVETNCNEIFNVDPTQNMDFSINTDWYRGSTTIKTYTIEELMGTKLRAIYQRKKGRDLFDAWYVFSKNLSQIDKSISIFKKYNTFNGVNISKKMFLKNIEAKKLDKDFRADIQHLIPKDINYSFEEAYNFIIGEVIKKI